MSDAADLKRTPLHAEHVRLGGKMIGFGGWDMPVQYTGIMDEHHAVRKALGVFDISHMGQFFARSDGSAGAAAWLNSMLTNNVNKLAPGQGQYTLMLNERGGVIDDLIIYRIADAEWLLVVNAAKITEDFAWLNPRVPAGVTLENRSEEFFGLAVQGPRAAEWFAKFSDGKTAPARNGVVQIEAAGSQLFICRTGYTGEDGFEVFGPAADAVSVLGAVLAAGAEFGIKPCGLGARDTLRMEAGMPLYGHEITEEIDPVSAGLEFAIKFDKGMTGGPDDERTGTFIGQEALRRIKEQGPARKLVGLFVEGRRSPRQGMQVLSGGQVVGELTSGCISPTLDRGIAMAFVPAALAAEGTAFEVDLAGKGTTPAVVTKLPFVSRV
jgi:aminomethyltransferase